MWVVRQGAVERLHAGHLMTPADIILLFSPWTRLVAYCFDHYWQTGASGAVKLNTVGGHITGPVRRQQCVLLPTIRRNVIAAIISLDDQNTQTVYAACRSLKFLSWKSVCVPPTAWHIDRVGLMFDGVTTGHIAGNWYSTVSLSRGFFSGCLLASQACVFLLCVYSTTYCRYNCRSFVLGWICKKPGNCHRIDLTII